MLHHLSTAVLAVHMNFRIKSMCKAQSRNLPEKAERNASVADDDVGISRSFVFSVLRAKERRGDDSQQSNKTEEQWRQWIAKYQVWIRSSVSPGLPSSVQLNYAL